MKSSSQAYRECLAQVGTYPSASELGLDGEEAANYTSGVNALRMKRDKKPGRDIHETTGYSRQRLHKAMKATIRRGVDGRPLGYRVFLASGNGLRPNAVSLAVLDRPKPTKNQLNAFFTRHSEAYDEIHEWAVRHLRPGTNEPEVPFSVIYGALYDWAKNRLKIVAPSYPFNSGSDGKVALRRLVKKWREKFAFEQRLAAIKRQESNDWSVGLSPPSKCFQEVQCDGHHVDVNWVLEVPGMNGQGVVRYQVSRLWLICLVERKSKAVLGYSVAFGENYTGADVARAIRSALVPWEPRRLTTTKVAYQEGECLPNALIPELAYACWSYLCMDNAMANLARYLMSSVQRTVGCVPVYGPVGAPNERPDVEGVFGLLEKMGFHNVRGTLGSHPKDPKKDNKRAEPFLLTLPLLLDLADLLICRYNASNMPGTTVSRLEILRNAATLETTVLRHVPLALREDCLKYDLYETWHIGVDKGRHVVRWGGVRYHNDAALTSRPGLVGEEVGISADSRDVRYIKVTLLRDGSTLGILEVEPRFRGSAHSLQTRKAAINYQRHNGYWAADIVYAFRLDQQRLADQQNKGRRAMLVQMLVEQGKVGETDTQAANDPPTTQPQAQPNGAVGQSSESAGTKVVSLPAPSPPSELERRIAAMGSAYSAHAPRTPKRRA